MPDHPDSAIGSIAQLTRLSIGSGLTARALEIFVTVARLQTMSAAAEHLGLSQPAISQAVQQMETALGVPLFDRSKRPPVLTLQGQALLDPARALVGAIGRFEQALQWGSGAPLPQLRIGMLNSFAETMGPLVLAALRPVAAQLIVDSGFDATRASAVADRLFDVVVSIDETPTPPEINSAPILTEPFLVVTPASYKGDPQALGTLSESLDLIRFSRDPFVISRTERTLMTLGIAPTHRYQMDTHEAVLQMVAAGEGWTILPPLAVYRAMARGDRLRIAPYPDASMKRQLKLFSRAGEGAQVVRHIHQAAIAALRDTFLPTVAALMPGVAELTTLHAPDVSIERDSGV